MVDRNSILLVEDDTEIGELISRYLENNGMTVAWVASGEALDKKLVGEDFDIIILDLNLPGEDGLSICRRVSASRDIPIIIVTAKGEDVDKIIGIEMGADDYLVKPFNPRELLARIKTILRRTRALPPNLRPEPARCLCFSGWCLDTATRVLTAPDGVVTPLSGSEFRLLRILLEHPNRVLNREQLTEMIHGREAEAYD